MIEISPVTVNFMLKNFFELIIIPAHYWGLLKEIRHNFDIREERDAEILFNFQQSELLKNFKIDKNNFASCCKKIFDIIIEKTKEKDSVFDSKHLFDKKSDVAKAVLECSLNSLDHYWPTCSYRNYLFPLDYKETIFDKSQFEIKIIVETYINYLLNDLKRICSEIADNNDKNMTKPSSSETRLNLDEIGFNFKLEYIDNDGVNLLDLVDNNLKYSDFTKFGKMWAEGAFGAVCLAYSPRGNLIALKKVNGFGDNTKFERELKAVLLYRKNLSGHKNIVSIHSIGLDFEKVTKDKATPFLFYTMELADNLSYAPIFYNSNDYSEDGDYIPMTLSNLFKNGIFLSAFDICSILEQLLDGIKYIHNKGFIHRDIKPDNIIMVNGVPKFADIGLCTEIDNINSIAGTPGFIPKELLESKIEAHGSINDIASDLYALGMTAYCCSTGNSPDDYPSGLSKLMKEKHGKKLMKIINKACSENRRDRFQTIDDFIKACSEPSSKYKSADELVKACSEPSSKYKSADELVKACIANPKMREKWTKEFINDCDSHEEGYRLLKEAINRFSPRRKRKK